MSWPAQADVPPGDEAWQGNLPPRGTVIHHYGVDEFGKITKANLIVARGHNNIAINRSVELVAK